MKSSSKVMMFLLIMCLVTLMATVVFAAGGGTGMPWDEGIMKIANSIKGPVAFAGLIIIGAGIVMSLRQHEFSAWSTTMLIFGLIVLTIGNLDKLLSRLGVSGALIP